MEKTCNKCEEVKPLEAFSKNKSRKDGYNLTCRECKSAYNKQHYLDNVAYYNDKAKRNAEVYREQVRNLKYSFLLESGGCTWETDGVRCDVKNPIMLDLDHMDGVDKFDSVSAMIARGFNIDKIKAEIEKCRVLCANHHRLRTAEQRGWWMLTDNAFIEV